MASEPRLAGQQHEVRAAGGLVLRRRRDGEIEIALVHRRTRDDWSLPKGKLDEGETAEAAALREVEEETGLRCEIVRPYGSTAYVDRRGRDKVVDYWVMRPVSGGFTPNREVDELRWLSVEEAHRLLSYATDRELLGRDALS